MIDNGPTDGEDKQNFLDNLGNNPTHPHPPPYGQGMLVVSLQRGSNVVFVSSSLSRCPILKEPELPWALYGCSSHEN